MIFSEDTNNFSLIVNPLKSIAEINKGLWLVLVGVDETPPHIALVSDGKYYSQSARKVDCGTSLERFLGVVERKQISSLFIQILPTNSQQPLQAIYKDLEPLNDGNSTCLSPIKKFFTEQISYEFGNVNYVFELLAIAESNELISECVSLYCDTANSKSITLPKYTLAQIKNKIQELSIKMPLN